MGHAAEIRRRGNWRQKNDRRDAELILEIMLKGDFPRVHRHDRESVEVLRMLGYRGRLIKMRTTISNSLQPIGISCGLTERARMLGRARQEQLKSARMTPVLKHQTEELITLLDPLNERISRADSWLKARALADDRVKLLMTHPGVGVLTALAVVNTLEPFNRFANQRKVVAYVGLEPMERSSAVRKRYLGISKAGSRLLRFLLGEAAQVASRSEPDLKRFYERLAKRRGKAKATVALARKLLIRCWIMLRDKHRLRGVSPSWRRSSAGSFRT
jgi:transposase